MKRIIIAIFLIIVSRTLMAGTAQAADSSREKAGIIYFCLDMEKAAGFDVTESDYRILDTILALAEHRIHALDTAAPGYPQKVMKEIDAAIEEAGIRGDYSQTDPYKNLLSYSLRAKKFDCDKYSFVFLAVAKKMDLPLYAVLLPSHMAIEWSDDRHHFYWETTDKNEYSRDGYISRFGLNRFHFKEDMYLARIPDEQLKNCYRYNMGIAELMTGKYREAYLHFDSSKALKGIHPFLYEMQNICRHRMTIVKTTALLEENHTHDSARMARARAYTGLKGRENNDLAIIDLNLVLINDPSNKEARQWRGMAYLNNFILGRIRPSSPNFKKALSDFNFVLTYDSSNAEVHLGKSILYRWVGNYQEAEKEIEEALKVSPSARMLVEKGNIYYNRQLYQEAIALYDQALEKDPHCIEALQSRGFAYLELEKRDNAAEDFFQAYYHGLMPYEYFRKYTMMGTGY